VQKISRAGQAIDDNVVHAHCKLDTNTHSEYVIVNALLLQQRLHEDASPVSYTCSAYRVCVGVDRFYTLWNATAPL
jgi:hypothetical protein